MDLLKAGEAKANAQNLPTLVVGSTPACFFAPGMLGARRVEQVVLPTRLGRLVALLRALLSPAARAAA